MNDGSLDKGLLLAQLQCVRPRLLPGTSVEGCGEGEGACREERDVCTSGRPVQRLPYST